MSKRTSEQASEVRIRMLGNHGEYRNGEVYPVGIDEANKLTGYGIAVLVSDAEERPEDEKAASSETAREGN